MQKYLRWRKSNLEKLKMKLSIKGMAVAAGLLGGGAILFVGLINLYAPNYGLSFLEMMSSVYPGFQVSHTVGSVMYGSICGLFDGAIAGSLLAWLYNSCART
jgi:hypothetical protein